MAADAATSTTASTVTRRMILAKILCYIQSKMNTSKHDFIVKTVVDFYSEDDIHEAKVLLFEECIETNMRLKTHRIETATHALPKIMSTKAHFEQYFSQIFQFEHNWLDIMIFRDKSKMYL